MSKTVSQFNQSRCRIESGIFFADDTLILLDGNPKTGFIVSERLPLAGLEGDDPEGWVEVEEIPMVVSGAWALSTCCCSWEGEGCLALRSHPDGRLLWVLHIETAEHFVSASLNGGLILATSGDYPDVWLWQIPLDTPWLLTVRPA